MKKFLITGHPRSGTGYAAALFSANGYDVGHEQMGVHGISSWQLPAGFKEFGHCDYSIGQEFERTIYLLREPCSAVLSIAFTEYLSEDLRREIVPTHGNMIERAAQSYIGWFNKFSAGCEVVATERLKDYMGFSKDAARDTNKREHPFIIWHELLAFMSDETREKFIDLSNEHKRLSE